MATCFDRWEKDPFFSAAEEVQESADRMESVYRRWIQEKKEISNPSNNIVVASAELLRDLQTALGTAKWQLEELDRAVRINDEALSAAEDTRVRHSQFVDAIGNQIVTVENSLKESNKENGGNRIHPWVKLDEGERDELALFLSSTLPQQKDGVDFLEKPRLSNGQLEKKNEKNYGHRRTASACADIGAWKISVPNEDGLVNVPPPKTPSFSCLAKAVDSASKVKWSKNGFRKLHQQEEPESILLRNNLLSRGCTACYERSKSCLNCGGEAYEKQLSGWLGTLQRQLQRSQYHIQYGRPIQMVFWAIIVVLLLVLVACRAI